MRMPKRPLVAALYSSASAASSSSSTALLLFRPRPTHPPPHHYLPRTGYSRSVWNGSMEGIGVDEKRPLAVDLGPCNTADGGDGRIWSSREWGQKIATGKRIFCNRSLNMKNIIAVGFDMDYTLAQYKPETFESMAYDGTVKKLVYNLGYPHEILEWTFDSKYMVRGLVLDKKRGNILKMDRHKYVKVAYHGFREMSKEEKVSTYGNTLVRDSFDEPDYALIDTLFSLAEAYLFAQLVDFMDKNPAKFTSGVEYSLQCSYIRMYKDVRAAVDLCHRDGTLKQMVAKDPGSSKPSFFHEENRANLFEVESETGMLLNTDNGILIPQVGSTSPRLPPKHLKKACRVFQGGNVAHLHKLLSIASSSQVLYVGDHIYGDILRSKKVLGWRTMLVVPELEQEVELLCRSREMRKKLRQLRLERDLVEDKIHHLKWSLKFDILDANEEQSLSSELHKLEFQREQVRCLHQDAQREHHQKFHKVWGQLMKTGYQNSRFAHQVERFACLYTSQVTNLSLYSPDKYYRPSEDFMPHEFDILGL
ncbi:hypothetical protein MUK42_10387 [Musa troglodytarum]|uniref:5'-nucleotidase domain-containing protein 4 n=1 Tax=Musa troglodytarum TaxID=320322 RepID=A0A9E7GYB3_9LILI|nr:hypothetical protein MUK42_10387 [Musa troglodytarum]